MNDELLNVLTAYDILKEEVEPLLFVARDKRLQEEGFDQVRRFVAQADAARIGAIMAKHDEVANDLLGLSCVAKALGAELQTYILLKDGQSEKAWDALIDAQDYVLAAGSASRSLTNLGAKFNHLRELEKWLFPPQTFVSGGFIATTQHCSICQDSYDKCNHIAGRAYGGRFCNLTLKNIRADHIALVENPYDRRCRVVSFSVPGGKRNKMTWAFTPSNSTDARTMTAIMAIKGAGGGDTGESE